MIGAIKLAQAITARLFAEMGWEEMKSRRLMHKLVLYYKIVNDLTPFYPKELCPEIVTSADDFSLLHTRTE